MTVKIGAFFCAILFVGGVQAGDDANPLKQLIEQATFSDDNTFEQGERVLVRNGEDYSLEAIEFVHEVEGYGVMHIIYQIDHDDCVWFFWKDDGHLESLGKLPEVGE